MNFFPYFILFYFFLVFSLGFAEFFKFANSKDGWFNVHVAGYANTQAYADPASANRVQAGMRTMASASDLQRRSDISDMLTTPGPAGLNIHRRGEDNERTSKSLDLCLNYVNFDIQSKLKGIVDKSLFCNNAFAEIFLF